MTLARKRLSVIHVAKARLGLDDEAYRAILMRCGGVTSSRDLDPAGFDFVMEAFHRLGFESDFSRRNFGHREGMASAAQVSLIRALWSEFTDGVGDDKSLGKWLERPFKVSAIRFLPADKAQQAIGTLKKMKARKAAKEAADA